MKSLPALVILIEAKCSKSRDFGCQGKLDFSLFSQMHLKQWYSSSWLDRMNIRLSENCTKMHLWWTLFFWKILICTWKSWCVLHHDSYGNINFRSEFFTTSANKEVILASICDWKWRNETGISSYSHDRKILITSCVMNKNSRADAYNKCLTCFHSAQILCCTYKMHLHGKTTRD